MHTVISLLILHHDANLLKIGNNVIVLIGSCVNIFPMALDLNSELGAFGVGLASTGKQAASVVIGNQAMVAEKCLMLPGVKIGRGPPLVSWTVLSQNQHLREDSVWLGSPSIMLQSKRAYTHIDTQCRNVACFQSLAIWDTGLSGCLR